MHSAVTESTCQGEEYILKGYTPRECENLKYVEEQFLIRNSSSPSSNYPHSNFSLREKKEKIVLVSQSCCDKRPHTVGLTARGV